MKKLIFRSFALCILIVSGCTGQNVKISRFDFTGEKDPSLIRGFNYTPSYASPPRHHADCWISYDSATIEFELDLAKSLDLNQVRIFVPYSVYTDDREALPAKLQHFVRECHKRGIGVMPVVGSGPWLRDTTRNNLSREWVQFLVDVLSDEPGLAIWDVMNEPDWPPTPEERVRRNFENCKLMSALFHELDPMTPVTIGMAFVDGMIELAEYVDVLQFHDYMQTREQIRNNIARAKEFASSVNKPLVNGEIGCIARANPYDIALREHMDAEVGWYIWELMIVRTGWGSVHGVFYEDGTVRDPSIAAAMMGFFRKRDVDILPADPDREGWVVKISDQGSKWLEDPEKKWDEGLDIAETAAHLLEAGELTSMRVLPTWEVGMLRQGEANTDALRKLIIEFMDQLEPFKKKPEVKN